ncbi:MAG TPA: SDR family oxidoreductase [Bacteroidia bacterium]|jgi:dTDP-4-dehydrorhamnose reductase|nr:SDR family oxidoreductase [Bacteroidia bacterium]
MSKKKILITGSNGLLGQKLVYRLLREPNVEVIATSKGPNRLVNQTGYTYQELDITNAQEVETTFKKLVPDVVVNTAAMTNVDACETEKELCYKMNVDAVQYIVNALKKLPNDPHLTHLSTDFIFDGAKGPYKETDIPIPPKSIYAESKFESETIVEESGLKWAILRTILVYGVVDNMSRSNIVLWAKDSLSKKKNINVVDDQFRSPTLAEDLAEGCALVALKGATGFYHISGKDQMSILEMVQKIADFWHLDKSLINPIKTNTLGQAAERPMRTGFIVDKARKDLGYEPHSFTDGLAMVDKQLKERGL